VYRASQVLMFVIPSEARDPFLSHVMASKGSLVATLFGLTGLAEPLSSRAQRAIPFFVEPSLSASRQSENVRSYWIYILSSASGTLYVGVTNNLVLRVAEHRSGLVDGFTAKYAVHRLVYYEETSDIWVALAREKQIKGWSRKKKMDLIKKTNPSWRDLSRGW